MHEYMTLREIAIVARVAKSSLYRWAHDPTFPPGVPLRQTGRTPKRGMSMDTAVYLTAEVITWLREQGLITFDAAAHILSTLESLEDNER